LIDILRDEVRGDEMDVGILKKRYRTATDLITEAVGKQTSGGPAEVGE